MTQNSTKAKPQTLFTNVYVFDGVHEKRIEHANVLVEGNLIKQISTKKIAANGATVIDGGGRTLIPGLIDAHWHTMFNFWPISKMLNADFGLHSIAAANRPGTPCCAALPRCGMPVAIVSG